MKLRRRAGHQVEDRWIINRRGRRAKDFLEGWDSILFQTINLSIHSSMRIPKYNEILMFPLIIDSNLTI